MKRQFEVIAFDADDTLWVNEPYFRETERTFSHLLSPFMEPELVRRILFRTEVKNMPLYGYGIKAFVLSMMETALEIGGDNLPPQTIRKIVALGREQLNKEVVLLDGVSNVLQTLHQKGQKMVVITKGDLLDQESKLARSGLFSYFHHVEVVSEKHENNYIQLLNTLDVAPENFLMVGNSVKSDILPVLNIGGFAVYVPFHETWEYEQTDIKIENPRFQEFKEISEIIFWLEL
ncbi:HAD family hydrolase [Bacteroidales bacterium]